MTIHVAQLALMQINPVTQEVFRKDSSKMNQYISKPPKPVTSPIEFETQFRVIENTDDAPSSGGSPTIKEYLEAEDALGFSLTHLDQTFIITTGP